MGDSDNLNEIYGPSCWHRIEADPGRLKKAMWLEIMTGFKCKASSTWVSCDDRGEQAFTHEACGKMERASQSDYMGSLNEEAEKVVMRKVTENGDAQKQVEDAAKTISFSTTAERRHEEKM